MLNMNDRYGLGRQVISTSYGNTSALFSRACQVLLFIASFSLVTFTRKQFEPRHEKTGFLPRRKQRRRSASR